MKTGIRKLTVRIILSRAFLGLLCLASWSSLAQNDPLDNWHGPASFPTGFGIVNGVAYGNGTFVTVGNNGAVAVSADGSNWTQYLSPPVMNYGGVAFGEGEFFAYGYWSSTNYILSSSNAQSWTKIYEFPYSSASTTIKAAAYGNNRIVFVGSDRIITTTASATNWIEFTLPSATPLSGVTFGAGRFVACGRSTSPRSHILSSLDGISWRYDYGQDFDDESVSGIGYGNGTFVAPWRTNGASDSGFLISTNLTRWDYVPMLGVGSGSAGAITFGGGQFIAGFGNNRTYTSPDGLNWTYRTNVSGSAAAFTYGLGTFLTSFRQQSDVFASPTSSPPSNLELTMFPGISVIGVEGQTYRIEASTNLAPGSVWQPLTNVTLPFSPYLWIDTSAPGLSQRFYRAVRLE